MSTSALEARDFTVQIDPVEEMKLRTWARRHYTEASNRDHRWHPIVLEEMSRRDQELIYGSH